MNRQYVVVLMTLAFLVYTVGRSPSKVELPPAQQLAAWGGLMLILAVLVDMDETAEVGSALVMLLLLSILLTYGEGLIKWANTKVGAAPPEPTTARIGTGRFAGKPVPY